MEAVQSNDSAKEDNSARPGEDSSYSSMTLESQIKRYESMLKAAEELKKLIDQRVRKESHH